MAHKILHTCTCIRDARLHTPAFEAKGHTKLRHLMWNGRIDAPALPPGSRAARGTGHASGARSLRITSAGVAVGVTKIGVALEALNHFSYCFRGEWEYNISSQSGREQERWVVLRRTGSSRKLWLKNDGSSHRRSNKPTKEPGAPCSCSRTFVRSRWRTCAKVFLRTMDCTVFGNARE